MRCTGYRLWSGRSRLKTGHFAFWTTESHTFLGTFTLSTHCRGQGRSGGVRNLYLRIDFVEGVESSEREGVMELLARCICGDGRVMIELLGVAFLMRDFLLSIWWGEDTTVAVSFTFVQRQYVNRIFYESSHLMNLLFGSAGLWSLDYRHTIDYIFHN